MNKINKYRHKKLIVISISVIYIIFFSGCYTTKEVIEGSLLRDTTSYEDIKNVMLKDSTKIKFGDKELRYDAIYSERYQNINDVIVYTTKTDTVTNEDIQINKKYDFIELKNILYAKVSKQNFPVILFVGLAIIFCVVVAMLNMPRIGPFP